MIHTASSIIFEREYSKRTIKIQIKANFSYHNSYSILIYLMTCIIYPIVMRCPSIMLFLIGLEHGLLYSYGPISRIPTSNTRGQLIDVTR